MEDFSQHTRHVVDLPRTRGIQEEATKMSDQEREKLVKQVEDGDETGEDVDAHIRKGRDANDEGDDSGDDVEAHVKRGRD